MFVDEAYADFSGRTLIGPRSTVIRNRVVGRTFAKAHGLAALRAGAMIAPPRTLAPIRRILPPYSLNVCAVIALEAALTDEADTSPIRRRVARVARTDLRMVRMHGLPFLAERGQLRPHPDWRRRASLVRTLASQGIHIRDKSRQPGLAGCVRITAGRVAIRSDGAGDGGLACVARSLNGAPAKRTFACGLTLEGRGRYRIATGHPVPRPHARTGRQTWRLRSGSQADGDLDVDQHHTVEDAGWRWARRARAPSVPSEASTAPATS